MKIEKHTHTHLHNDTTRILMCLVLCLKSQIDVEEIVHAANNEVLIEQTLDQLIAKWNQLTFTFHSHSKRKHTRAFTLEHTDKIIQIFEDDAMQLQILSTSP